MKNLNDKLYNAFNKFLTDMEGGYLIFGVAIVAIIFAIIGFHGTTPFNWKWFVFFEIPLYGFCIWALWQAFKMYKGHLDFMKKTKNTDEKKNERF